MNTNKNLSLADDPRKPWITILTLAWPILVEQFLTSLSQAVDTAMVGSLGAVATTAVSINQTPNFLVNSVIMALGVGFTSLISRSIGAGKLDRARSLVRQAILLVTAWGIPMTILMQLLARAIPTWMGGASEILDTAETYNRIFGASIYFRCMTMILTSIYRGYGNTRTPMKVNIAINLLNLVGNYLMIFPTREITVFGMTFSMFGFGWGVAGAALSTSLSAILGSLVLLIRCFTVKNEMRISLKDGFKPNKEELKDVITLSVPTMLQNFVMSAAGIIVTSSVATLGTVAVAAQSLSNTAESLSFMPGVAFSGAVTTLYGQCIGAKRPDKAHQYLMSILKIGAGFMVFMTLLLFFGSTAIMGLFTPDPEVIRHGSVLLKILASIQITQTITFCINGALQGAGDTKTPLYIAAISMWGIRILGVLLCVRVLGMGLYSVCVCMCVDNFTRFVLASLAYKKGKWKKIAGIE